MHRKQKNPKRVVVLPKVSESDNIFLKRFGSSPPKVDTLRDEVKKPLDIKGNLSKSIDLESAR